MKLKLNRELVDIGRGRSVELRGAFGVEVVCVIGCLWLTEDKACQDLILRAGDSQLIRSDGRATITALDPSAIRLIEPAGGLQLSGKSGIGALLRSFVRTFGVAMGAARLGAGEH
ncbi:MAG TPA: DUF2917 domain-containing protein [Burkholderiaceae bacterium]|nr:DUF2917 domain-containing protein [Burkholderiaceae bacterium]